MNNNIQVIIKSSTAEMSLNSHEDGIYIVPELDGLTGLPNIRTTSGVNAGYDGGWTSAQNFDARSITIRGVIAKEDEADVERMRRELSSLLGQGKSEQLTLDIVTENGAAYEMQVRTIACEMAMQRVLTQQEFMIQLRADDPLIYDNTASGEAATIRVQQPSGGFEIPFELPLLIGGGGDAGVIDNHGLEEVYPIVKMYGALHNPTIINQTTNQQMQLDVELGYAEGAWYDPETAEGNPVTISNAVDAPFKSVEILGNAIQNGTPTPSAPVAVQTTTGENVVQICGKNLYDEQLRAGDISKPTANPTIRLCSTQNLYLYPGTYTFSSNIASPMRYALGVNSVSAPPTGTYPTYIYDSGWTVGTGSNTTTFTINQGGYFSVQLSKVDNAELTTSEAQAYHCQLELGSTATTYEAYQEQSYEINLGKNLINFSSFQQSWDGASVNGEGTTITMSPNTSGSMGLLYDSATYSVSIPAGQMITWSRTWAGGGTWESGTITFPLKLTYSDGTTETLSFGDTTEGNYSQVISATKTLAKPVVSVKIESGGCFGITNLSAPTSFNLQLEFGSQATPYAAYFEPIELCKIGTYQDYLYKSGEKWYVHKATGKAELGTITWTNQSWGYQANTGISNIVVPANSNTIAIGIGTCFIPITMNNAYGLTGSYDSGLSISTSGKLMARATSITDLTTFNAAMAGQSFYYALATPTDTEITNEALIEQLDAVLNSRTKEGTMNVALVATAGNATGTLELAYFTAKDEPTRDEVVIDSRLRTITLNGVDIYHLQEAGSEFLMLAPGQNKLLLRSDNISDNGYAEVNYKQGYLSI